MPRGRIQINVVQRDINWGIRGDSSRCVVVRAVARAVPDATRIEVDTQTIRFTSGGKRLAYLTPLTVQGYVAAFDAADPISPFSFQLREPMEIRRRLVLDESKPLSAAKARHSRAVAKTVKEAAATGETVPAVSTSWPGIKSQYTAGRQGPPRVFKLKARTYGHRQLRINRPKVEETAGV